MRYPITPVPKPRMTQRDKWLNPPRPKVARYRAFCDECRLRRVHVPGSGATVIFTLPMPPSWSKKKRREMDGAPHQQTPDVDNLCTALLDAVYTDDSIVWDIRIVKRWGVDGGIEVDSSPRRSP